MEPRHGSDASGVACTHDARMHSPVADGQHPTRVLVVDADRRVRASLERLITVSDGFTCVRTVDNPTDALAALETQPVDAVLIDPRLPDIEVGLALPPADAQRGGRT